MKKYIYAVLLLLLALLVSITYASTETPSESPQENACYAGGSLEGKCNWPTEAETAWAWACGWYIARIERGASPVGSAPDWCGLSAGDNPLVIPPVFLGACYSYTGDTDSDIRFIAPPNTYGNVIRYSNLDGSCATINITLTVVYALDAAAALETCVSLNASYTIVSNLDIYQYVPSGGTDALVGFYICSILI